MTKCISAGESNERKERARLAMRGANLIRSHDWNDCEAGPRSHRCTLRDPARVLTCNVRLIFSTWERASLPTKERARRRQCAVATRELLESGFEGVVVRCLTQDLRSASSTSGSTTHSDLRHTVDSSLITRYRARSSIRFSRNESGLLIDRYVRFFKTSATWKISP